MAEVEHVVAAVEAADGISAAVDAVHPPDADKPVGLVGALRSIRRRVRAVRAALIAMATLLPERFEGVPTTLTAFGEVLGEVTGAVLVRLRELAQRHLSALPAPFGFRARVRG